MARQASRTQTLRDTLTERRGTGGGPFSYVRAVWGELRKVVWPSREDATRLTMLVIGVAVVIGILLGLIDLAFNQVFTRFILGV